MLLDTFENKYIIKGTLKALNPLHIGSGKNNYSPQDADNTVIRNAMTGEPFIPGSSIKGTLRTYLETILPTIGKFGKTCIVTENPCWGTKEKKRHLKELKEDYKQDSKGLAEQLYSELCPICRIFGSQVMASKIQINDAQCKTGTNYKIETRDGVAIDRDSGTAADRHKYEFECVSAGAEFEFYMSFDNIEKEYEPLIKMLLNILRSGELKLGGKKSVGLGDVQLINYKLYKIEKSKLMDYALKGETEEMRWENV